MHESPSPVPRIADTLERPDPDHALLPAYLERIGYSGPLRPDLETLGALQRHHLAAIPFENIDVLMGRPPGLERDEIFGKLVTNRRGGWCYEMNGIFGRMLQTIGFRVTRVNAGVMREHRGDAVMGNHLALIAHLDRDYVVDVGFGGSQSRPLPLEQAEYRDGPFHVTLAPTADGYWRYSDRIDSKPFSFDFEIEQADEALLAYMNGWQAHDAESPFVQNLVVQRRIGDRHLSLRGLVFKESTTDGIQTHELQSATELVETLRDRFGLDMPEAERLWPAILLRHAALFGN